MSAAAINPNGAPAPAQAQNKKAAITAGLCLLLALLTACTTGWFVVEGIQATEPASNARYAKVAAGVLLLVLELATFGLAGQWPEHSKTLRTLGWCLVVLEIVLMSVSQIAIGMTAAKVATSGAGTAEQLNAQAKEARAAAASLRADAETLRKSKHAWNKEEAAKKSAEAAEQSKAAGQAVAQLEKMDVAKVSTPAVEVVGMGGLIALSLALSAALTGSGIVMMHIAGSMWRRAGGALPVDQQILRMLKQLSRHGAVRSPAPAPARKGPARAPAPAPAPEPEEDDHDDDVAPARSARTLEKAPEDERPPFGFIPATSRLQRVNDDTPANDTRANVGTLRVNDDTPPRHAHVNDDTPTTSTMTPPRTRAPRAVRGEIMDTGTGEHDGHRCRRALELVKAGKARLSQDGLYKAVRATRPVANRYLEAWHAAGEIEPNPSADPFACKWVLTKKGGSK